MMDITTDYENIPNKVDSYGQDNHLKDEYFNSISEGKIYDLPVSNLGEQSEHNIYYKNIL